MTLANRGERAGDRRRHARRGTARRLSALRPRAPIFAATERDETARRLTLYWGVVPVRIDIGENVDAAGSLIAQQLVARRPRPGRAPRRARQHQRRSDSDRHQLPEDSAAVTGD